MCTVTWFQDESGYSLFSNRDEKRERPMSTGPRVHIRDGVRFIAPVDTAFGGTWIACNEYGVALCLLNGAGPNRGVKTRGCVVMELASAATKKEVRRRIFSRDLSLFAAFMVVVLQPRSPAMLIAWDGSAIAVVEDAGPLMPLASSSFDVEGVRSSRHDLFARTAAARSDRNLLRDFHASHGDGASAYSPCMHRPDAQTVSFTEVRVMNDGASLLYRPGAPCENRSAQIVSIERRRC